MKKFIFFITLLLATAFGLRAQDYSLVMNNQGRDGSYQVKITAILDKKQNKTAADYLKRMAVDGIMFRGVAAAGGFPAQSALISDPSVAHTKADFFTAFFGNKEYDRYVNLNLQNITVTKLQKGKFEVSGIMQVNKEALIEYLTQHGIISGFGDLW